jgi:hypothetical protein
MKRLIAVVALSVLAVPAFAGEDSDDSGFFDQRAVRFDREAAINASFKSPWATGPWANDYHFISPAQ